MAKIYEFPRKNNTEIGRRPVNKDIEERNAIILLDKERYDFMRKFKRNNLVNVHSKTYRDDFEQLKKNSKIWIAEMINKASELEINKNQKYFIAAFNILLE